LVPTPGAQCPGKHKFEFSILPHPGDWQNAYRTAYNYLAPLLVARADTHEGLNLHEMNITRDDPAQIKLIPWPRSGENPSAASILTVDPPELVLSALYRTQDGQSLIVRIYNISTEPVTGRISLYRSIEEAWLVNMNEERQEKISLEDERSLSLAVKGNQVVTIELIPKG
jgi:alpha-mannosidase